MKYSDRSDLKLMLADMDMAPSEFAPTNFWKSGLPRIIDDIEKYGLDKFREHDSATRFYVQRYRPRFSIFQPVINWLLKNREKISHPAAATLFKLLDGSDKAKKDYSIYRAASENCERPVISVKGIGESGLAGGELYEFSGHFFSRSMLCYLRALSFLNQVADGENVETILELGGGYGTLGEIFLKADEAAFYLNIDIPPVAAVSTSYLKRVFGAKNVLSYSDSRNMDELDLEELRENYRAVVLCPWQLPKLRGEFDMFANFISFQEMEPHVVSNYAQLIQPLIRKFVLVRNSASGKPKVNNIGEVGVFEPVTIDFIVKQFDKFALLDRDSQIYGDESSDGFFRSEVCILSRE